MKKKELSVLAKNIIRHIMLDKELTYVDLHKALEAKNYRYTVEALRSKVSRGSYDIRFLLEIADALNLKINISDK